MPRSRGLLATHVHLYTAILAQQVGRILVSGRVEPYCMDDVLLRCASLLLGLQALPSQAMGTCRRHNWLLRPVRLTPNVVQGKHWKKEIEYEAHMASNKNAEALAHMQMGTALQMVPVSAHGYQEDRNMMRQQPPTRTVPSGIVTNNGAWSGDPTMSPHAYSNNKGNQRLV